MNELTSRWKQIRQDHPTAHAVLRWAAATIFDAKDTSIPFPAPSDVDLSPAIDLGLLMLEEEKVSIPDAEILQDYLVRHAAEGVALPAWDELEAFTRAFEEIQHRGACLKMRQETATGVLLVLAHDHSKDLLSRVAEAARWAKTQEERNWPFWAIYPSFCDALPQLHYAPASLARDLEPVIQAADGDLSGGSVYGAVEKMAERSQGLAESLVDAFIARPDSPVVALADSALIALATFDLKNAHDKALALLDSPKPTLRRVGISSLGRFDYTGDTEGGILHITLEHLERLWATPDADTDYVLVRAYGGLLQHAEQKASEALIEMAARSNPAVQNQASFVLFQTKGEAYDKPWFQEALLRLARVPSSQTRTLQNLDYCAARCVREFPQVALSFVQKLVTSREYGREGREFVLPEMLSSTYMALREHQPERLTEAVTHWFASDDPRLHLAARDIVQHRAYASVGSPQPMFTLSKTVLETLSEQPIVHMLMRIMGHVAHSRTLAALLASALQRDPCPPTLAGFVAEALSEYVLYNYPGEAGEYLRSKLEGAKDDSENIEHRVIRTALTRSGAYLEARRQLPASKELQPPSHRVYLLLLAQQKQHASKMDEAEEQSLLLSLVHRVPLKYGRAFFTEVEGTFSAPSPLGSLSAQWEPPRGEFIDPLGQEYQRMQWRHAGLSEPDDEVQQDDGEESDS